MQTAEKSIREVVHDALVDIFNATQRDVTPAQLISKTGYNKYTVSEQLDKLVAIEMTVVRRVRGYYRPAVKFNEARPMSRTILPNGINKVEIGDHCLELVPTEVWKFGQLFNGNSVNEAEIMEQNRVLVAQLAAQVRIGQKRIEALELNLRMRASEIPQLALGL